MQSTPIFSQPVVEGITLTLTKQEAETLIQATFDAQGLMWVGNSYYALGYLREAISVGLNAKPTPQDKPLTMIERICAWLDTNPTIEGIPAFDLMQRKILVIKGVRASALTNDSGYPLSLKEAKDGTDEWFRRRGW